MRDWKWEAFSIVEVMSQHDVMADWNCPVPIAGELGAMFGGSVGVCLARREWVITRVPPWGWFVIAAAFPERPNASRAEHMSRLVGPWLRASGLQREADDVRRQPEGVDKFRCDPYAMPRVGDPIP